MAVTLAAFAGAFLISEPIFVLNEGRTYFLNQGFVDHIGFLNFWLYPQGVNSRFTSMYFANALYRTCGLDRGCTNALESSLVGLQCLLFFLHGFQLLGNATRALLVTSLWFLSSAALSGIVWQSIQHDKIAVILIVLTMIMATGFFSQERRSIYAEVAMALGLIPLFGIAFNAKEIAFYLPIGVTLFAVLFGLPSRSSLVRNLIIVAPSLIYAAVYIIHYYLYLNSSWAEHIAGGTLRVGLEKLLLLTFNLGVFLDVPQYTEKNHIAWWLYGAALLAFASFGAAATLKQARRKREWTATPLRLLVSNWREIYLMSLIGIFYGMFARTQYPSAFYIMIPTWAVLCLFVLLVMRCRDVLRLPAAVDWAFFGIFTAPFLLAYATNFRSDGFVPRIARASEALETTAATVRSLVPASQVRELVLGVDDGVDMDWYLLHGARGDSLDLDLPAYLFLDPNCRPSVRREVRKVAALELPNSGKLVIMIDRQYRFAGLQFEGHEIVPVQAPDN